MPLIALLHLAIGIGFAYHAMQTGRAHIWLYILLFIPLVGPLAYVIIELLPELGSTRRARRVAAGIGDVINPDKEWKHRYEEALRTDSAETKRFLAEECERKRMWPEAIILYQKAAQGVFADDTALLLGLARAQLGSGDGKGAEETLDRLRAAHPDMTSQDGHLFYARALEMQNRLADAAKEYEALTGYYAGL
ncbi:MAG: tetratricopeptide repeat protein [Rhodomicrobium sp.]|nr:tetratricopeptide repeat protein [Rhodomicrobium sp.]